MREELYPRSLLRNITGQKGAQSGIVQKDKAVVLVHVNTVESGAPAGKIIAGVRAISDANVFALRQRDRALAVGYYEEECAIAFRGKEGVLRKETQVVHHVDTFMVCEDYKVPHGQILPAVDRSDHPVCLAFNQTLPQEIARH